MAGDDHGGPGPGRVGQGGQDDPGPAVVLVSGGLVSQDDGRIPARARAAATRWRSPPESRRAGSAAR